MIGGFNGFALGSLIDWFGWFVMGCLIIFMIAREHSLLQKTIKRRSYIGSITLAAVSESSFPFHHEHFHFHRGLAASRFYQVCGELAHKKEQLIKTGGRAMGNAAIIQSLRSELVTLATRVRA